MTKEAFDLETYHILELFRMDRITESFAVEMFRDLREKEISPLIEDLKNRVETHCDLDGAEDGCPRHCLECADTLKLIEAYSLRVVPEAQ